MKKDQTLTPQASPFQNIHGSLPATTTGKIFGSFFGVFALGTALLSDPIGLNRAITETRDQNSLQLETKVSEAEITPLPLSDTPTPETKILNLAENDFIGPTNINDNIGPTPQPGRSFTKTLKLARGNTLMQLVTRAGANRGEAYNAITSLETKLNTRKLQIGQEIEVTFKEDSLTQAINLEALTIKTGFDQKTRASLGEDNKFSTSIVDIPVMDLQMFSEGIINDSLFLSAKREGVPNEITAELIRIFSFDVDFQREIRKGDGFKVYYDRRMSEETGEVANGPIKYASLILRGKEKAFYRFTPTKGGKPGRTDFFNTQGQSARKALMKTPVDGARLSSSFGQRKHPVLGYTRMHKGADFAVYTGTPIMAAGDGVIERSSRYGSYGNYVRIRHNSTYKTAYAHLSRYGRGIKSGVRVKQGQIIGYSGATGRVTGAHLHYEVLMDGKQVNPMTLKMPTGEKLDTKNMSVFEEEMAKFNNNITTLKAQNETLKEFKTALKAP